MRVARGLIRLAMEIARNAHPREFLGFLRERDGVVKEIQIIPGTVTTGSSAFFRSIMQPIDFHIVGSIHSHPSGSVEPSPEDLITFSRTGKLHIIVAYPYREDCWAAYDREGRPVQVELVD